MIWLTYSRASSRLGRAHRRWHEIGSERCGAFQYFLRLGKVARDGVRSAIVFHDARVSDGNIRGALIKAVLGIAEGLEERSDQIISLSNRGLGVIEEADCTVCHWVINRSRAGRRVRGY